MEWHGKMDPAKGRFQRSLVGYNFINMHIRYKKNNTYQPTNGGFLWMMRYLRNILFSPPFVVVVVFPVVAKFSILF